MKNSVRSYGYSGTVPCGRLCRGIIGKMPFLETENILEATMNSKVLYREYNRIHMNTHSTWENTFWEPELGRSE
jgi:hypothetical protein